MPPKRATQYLREIRAAIEEAGHVGDGAGVPRPEDLLANLAARGLMVVEVPVGFDCAFVGVE